MMGMAHTKRDKIHEEMLTAVFDRASVSKGEAEIKSKSACIFSSAVL